MILFLLILILTFLAGLIFPWWILIPIVFLLCCWLSKSLKSAFLISFFAVFLLWLALNFYYSIANNHILTKRVAELFGLGSSPINWLWVALLSPLPGAITAGFAGASGYLTKQLFIKNHHEFTKFANRDE
jgi:hypothetical protein